MTLPNIRLLLITIVVSFAANWQFGYQITYINPAYNVFRKFAEDISVSPNDISKSVPFDDADFSFWWGIIVSSFYPGTVIGFVIVPYMINRFGTRASFAYSCIPAILGCLLQSLPRFFAYDYKEIFPILLIVGRTLIGIQSGCSLSLLPLFIIEISEESENSFLCTFQQISQATCTLLGLLIGSNEIFKITEYKYEFLQIVGVIPTLLFWCFITLAPNTPFFILMKNYNPIHYAKSVIYYRGNQAGDIMKLKEQMFQRVKSSAKTKNKSFTKRNVWKGLVIGCIAAISYAFTADDMIDSYSSNMIRSAFPHLADLWIDLTAVFFGSILLVCSVFGSFLIEKYGAKKSLVYGLIGTAIANAVASIGDYTGYFYITALAFCLSKVFIGLGAGGPGNAREQSNIYLKRDKNDKIRPNINQVICFCDKWTLSRMIFEILLTVVGCFLYITWLDCPDASIFVRAKSSLLVKSSRHITTNCLLPCKISIILVSFASKAWFLTSELVPVHSQNIAQSMSTGCLLMATGVVTYLYPTINKSLGSFTLLYMASIPALILATILVLFLPEVHKKNYSQINYKLRAFFFSGLNHKESSNDEERNINMYIVQPEIATEYPVNILKIQNYGTCASDINKHTQSLGLF